MSEKVRASHILLMYAGSERSTATRSQADAKTQIDELHGRIAAGEDFAELAKKHSDCPSGRSGGDLGPFGRGQMVPAFETTTYALELNGLSDVVETPFGYHVIKRTG